MVGLMISMTSFGLSKTFTGLVVRYSRCPRKSIVADLYNSRSITGFLSGNIGVAKSMMGEFTDSTNRAQVSGLLPMVWAMGGVIGYVSLCPGMDNSHRRTTALLLAGHSRTRTKDSRNCSGIGSGKNILISCHARSPRYSVLFVSSSRGYS